MTAGLWIFPAPEAAKSLTVLDAEADAEKLAGMVDFCFCAVDMTKDDIRALEEAYAKLECPVVSNNSAHRWTDGCAHGGAGDQRRASRRSSRPSESGWAPSGASLPSRSNCSLQSYVPALHPLMKYGLEQCAGVYLSGHLRRGENLRSAGLRWWITCIPYIGGEEEKSEQEPLKLWGRVENGRIVKAEAPAITAQCFRVACQRRPYGRSVHEIQGRLQALHGADQSGLGRIPGPSAGIAAYPPPPSNSSTILRNRTAPRPVWTGCWSGAWRCLWAVCGRIPSMTTNLSG